MMSMRHVLALPVCAAIGGCGSLLPRGSLDTPEGFTNFQQAQAGIERIVALQTSTSELKSFGFDPVAGRNVTLIPYPDIIARLAPHPGGAD